MNPDKPIRDYVLPIVEVSKTSDGYRFERFHGTCFLVGTGGFALTNAHLLGTSEGNTLGVLTIPNSEWAFHEIAQSASHSSEDVALLHVPSISYPSFLKISSSREYSSFPYMQWSYPEDVAQEIKDGWFVRYRPDLIYLEGYIRRRMTNIPIDGIKGGHFYEVNEPGSVGCSGSPLISKRGGGDWEVVGIFVGNRRTQLDVIGYSAVGYAVRADAIHEWSPELLGRKLSEL